jgi:DNA-binding CsgD family transcriptional regulator
LYVFKNQRWLPVTGSQLLNGQLVSGIFNIEEGSLTRVRNDFKAFKLKGDTLSPRADFASHSFKDNIFRTIPLNNRELAIATIANGCLITDLKGNIIQKIDRQEGLKTNNVICIFQDRNGNIWTGLSNGIAHIAYNSAFKYISPDLEKDVSVYSTLLLKRKLWLGTSNGVFVTSLSSIEGDISFQKGSFQKIPNTSGQTWRLSEVNDKLLIAHTNGLFQLGDNASTARQISREPGWLFQPTSSLYPVSALLTGTYSGLKKLSFDGEQFTDKGNLKGTYESLRFLTQDTDGFFWASHPFRGIYRLNVDIDSMRYTSELFTEKEGLPSLLDNHVFSIRNRVVFATQKGIYEFQPSKRTFIRAAFLDSILGDRPIRYLSEDDEGRIWFVSGKELGVVDPQSSSDKRPTVRIFPEITGKILSGFEQVYPFNKKNIFIASDIGLIHLNYEKYINGIPHPGILINQIRARGESDSLLFSGYVVQQPSSSLQLFPKLPFSLNSIHIEYSTPAFAGQESIRYRLKLDGSEERWSEWTSKTDKDYSNLPAGSYTFRVQAKDGLGHVSEETSFSFQILPPWYQSSLANLIYFLLTLAVVFLIRRHQQRKLLRQKKLFEEKQRQMEIMHQLEMEKNEKEIIRLQNRQLENEVLLKTKELADTSMHLAERQEALLKVKESLQRLYRNTNNNHDIRKTLLLLSDIERNDENWEKFASHFDEINNNLFHNLRKVHPKLTTTDMKLCAYLELRLSSKEIAQMMNISVRGVEIARYRLRKKLQLQTDYSITVYLQQLKKNDS